MFAITVRNLMWSFPYFVFLEIENVALKVGICGFEEIL